MFWPYTIIYVIFLQFHLTRYCNLVRFVLRELVSVTGSTSLTNAGGAEGKDGPIPSELLARASRDLMTMDAQGGKKGASKQAGGGWCRCCSLRTSALVALLLGVVLWLLPSPIDPIDIE